MRIFENICFTKNLPFQVSFLIYSDFRSSRLQMFFKIFVLKNFSIFTGKHLCWSLFLIKLLISLFFNIFIKDIFNIFIFILEIEEKRFFKIVGSIVSNMERINIKKEHNQHNAVFKVLRQVSYYLNFTDLWITPLIFSFYLVMN